MAFAGMVAGWTRMPRASPRQGGRELAPQNERLSRRALGLCSTLAVAQAVIYWCLLPYNTQERFLSPALGFALVPLSVVLTGRPVLQSATSLLLAWQLLAAGGLGSPSVLQNVFAPVGRPDGGPWTVLLIPVSLVGAGVLLIVARRGRWPLAAAVVATGCLLAARPAAASLGRQPLRRFYPWSGFAERLRPGWEILEGAAAGSGSRVAYAGTNLPYYLLGVGLRNEVKYVNINDHLDWLPHDYHRQRRRAGRSDLASDPWPQWYPSEADFDAWMKNLHRHRIEFLFVARENRHGRLEPVPGELPAFPVERRWADAHPESFIDLGPYRYPPGVVPWVRVYRVR